MKCKKIEVPRTPMMVQKTSCPKNDDQHCQRKKKTKAHASTMMINIVEESKNQKHVGVVDNKNHRKKE